MLFALGKQEKQHYGKNNVQRSGSAAADMPSAEPVVR